MNPTVGGGVREALDRVRGHVAFREAGKITKSLGLIFEAQLPGAAVGSVCRILSEPDLHSDAGMDAEVIGFRDKKAILMPFDDASGVNNQSLVVLRKAVSSTPVGYELLGRVIDARGEPIDGKGPLFTGPAVERSLYQKPSHP